MGVVVERFKAPALSHARAVMGALLEGQRRNMSLGCGFIGDSKFEEPTAGRPEDRPTASSRVVSSDRSS
jgi:hypothetical protein